MLDLLEAPSGYDRGPRSDLRRCSRCGAFKPADEFAIKNKLTGLRVVWCRPCRRAYGKEHYLANRGTYLSRAQARRRVEIPRIRSIVRDHLRANPCVDCSETDPDVLDFDHRDSSLKRGIVSRLVRGASLAGVLAEVAKCDVRCANCHRKRTAEQFEWKRLRGIGLNPAETRPGKAGRYARIQAPRQELLFSQSTHGMRRCSRCRELKALTEFSFRDIVAGARGHYCRSCQAKYRRAHYEANRADYLTRAVTEVRLKLEDQLTLVHDYLRSHPCVDCGETDILTLEFDHIDPRTKILPVSYMIGRRNWTLVAAEIAKCEVRCVNCHRRRTSKQQGWHREVRERRARYAERYN